MNNDFDDELGRTGAGRSRRRPNSEPTNTKDYTREDYSDSTEGDVSYEERPVHQERPVRQNQPESRGRADSLRTSPAGARLAAKNARAKKRKRIIIMVIAEILALTVIFGVAFVKRYMNMINRPEYNKSEVINPELNPEQQAHMKGYRTIAVFGVDSRDGNVSKGTNADVNMLCNINMDTGEIKLVSVYRDSYLNISDKNSYNKINAAYAQGGPQQAVKALNKNLDLNITDYVTFNWKAVADGINILEGIDVDISKAEFAYINSFITETVNKTGVGSHHLKKAGMNHLDGVQAVAYGRLRLMDTDYARTERQRLIIEKAFEKAKVADYSVLNNILVVALPNIASSLDFSDMTDLALSIGKFHIGETAGFPSAKGDMTMGKRGDCVIPQTLESNVIELHKFLYDEQDYKPTETLKKISAKIAADSGMYKQGKKTDKVGTDGGVVPKETAAKETTKAVEEESTTAADESSTAQSDGTKETKPNETTGSKRPGETDANGNPVPTTSAARPTQGETKPTKPNDKPAATAPPKESTAPTTASEKPGETTSDGRPGEPEETTASQSPDGGTTAPTIAPAPITPGDNESTGPGGSAATTSPVVTGGPGM